MPEHQQRAHARLAPSGAHRWLYCNGCVELVESLKLPEVRSEPAERGTAQHEMLEERLTKAGVRPGAQAVKKYNGYVPDRRMLSAVQEAYDLLLPLTKRATKWGAETRVSIPSTGEFGTVDFWALCTYGLHVRDFKSGRNAVEAKNNEQMMLYAEGLIHLLKLEGKPKMVVELGIIQPNAHGAETEELHVTNVGKILEWARTVAAPAAARIKAGGAPCRAGKWCDRCKAAGRCETLARANAKTARMDWADFIDPKKPTRDLPAKLGNAELATILERLPMLKAMIDGARREAMLALVRAPDAIKGWKLVEGRTKRKWKDPAATMKRLVTAGYSIDDVAPRELASLSEIAGLLPKEKRDAFMERHAFKPRGKPALAPANDRRPSISSNARMDFADDILSDEEPEDG